MLSTRYVMRPLTPRGNNSDGLIKKISTDSQQCGSHCNKKKIAQFSQLSAFYSEENTCI